MRPRATKEGSFLIYLYSTLTDRLDDCDDDDDVMILVQEQPQLDARYLEQNDRLNGVRINLPRQPTDKWRWWRLAYVQSAAARPRGKVVGP